MESHKHHVPNHQQVLLPYEWIHQTDSPKDIKTIQHAFPTCLTLRRFFECVPKNSLPCPRTGCRCRFPLLAGALTVSKSWGYPNSWIVFSRKILKKIDDLLYPHGLGMENPMKKWMITGGTPWLRKPPYGINPPHQMLETAPSVVAWAPRNASLCRPTWAGEPTFRCFFQFQNAFQHHQPFPKIIL